MFQKCVERMICRNCKLNYTIIELAFIIDGDSGICDEVFKDESPTKTNGVSFLGKEVFSTPMNGICETVT